MRSLLAELEEWVAENSKVFPWQVHLCSRKQQVFIEIENLNPLITIRVSRRALRVSVDWEGENIDSLLWLEIVPVRKRNGYFCQLCDPDATRIFHTIAEMRQENLYSPFLEWCQKNFFRAKYLFIFFNEDYSEARLIAE